LRKEKLIARYGLKHGLSKSPTYNSWHSMIQRCNNINSPDYKRYGKKGITVCNTWLIFDIFLKDMGIRPDGKTLNRINNNLGYNKDNCEWSTYREQGNNRSDNAIVVYNGKTQTISQWATELNMTPRLLYSRINRQKWSLERSFTTPARGYLKLDHAIA